MKKRLLALLTALCMVLGLLSMSAMATCTTCVDEDSNYVCDVCYEVMEHPCADLVFSDEPDYRCDICGDIIAHTCEPMDDKAGVCKLCYAYLPHDHVDANGDYECDLCWDTIEHTCEDADSDYWCDLCRSVIDHDHVDADGSYYCDLCDVLLRHPHDVDADENGECDYCGMTAHTCSNAGGGRYCDVCYELLPHTCASEDGDVWCDICDEPVPHDCVDADGDYRCDLCYEQIEHTCVSEDGDAWCDLCGDYMEHTCADADENYRCDLCHEVMAHDCISEDGDALCDVCYGVMEHTCEDADSNGRCELCYDLMEGHVHSYDAGWDGDNQYHYHVCICGDGDWDNAEPHQGGTATCQGRAVCQICQLEYGAIGEHVDADGNGKCDTCGYDENGYGVWVGGVQVCPDNASDVLGDGKVSYDHETKTLTLDGAAINGSTLPGVDQNIRCGIYAEETLKLVLKGTNTVKAGNADRSFGIGAMKLVISGSGSLNVSSGEGNESGALYAWEMTIQGGTIKATGGDAVGISAGVMLPEGSSLKITGGDLTAKAGKGQSSVGVMAPEVIISGGNVTASAAEEQEISVGILGETVKITGGTVKASGDAAVVGMESISVASGLTVSGAKEGTYYEMDALLQKGSAAVTIRKPKPSDPTNPDMGDTTPVVLLTMALVASAAGLLVVSKKRYSV